MYKHVFIKNSLDYRFQIKIWRWKHFTMLNAINTFGEYFLV